MCEGTTWPLWEVGVSGQVNNRVPGNYPLTRNGTRPMYVFLSEKNPLRKGIKGKAEGQSRASSAIDEGVGAHGKAGMTPSPLLQRWISRFSRQPSLACLNHS